MEQKEDFEQLRKLLALKRHEVPPPGYFESLPRKVMTRVEMTELGVYSTWWEWLVARFDAKPLLACLYGFGVSTLLLLGFRIPQWVDADIGSGAAPSGPWLAATPDPLTMPAGIFPNAFGGTVGLIDASYTDEPIKTPRPHFGNVQTANYTFVPVQ